VTLVTDYNGRSGSATTPLGGKSASLKRYNEPTRLGGQIRTKATPTK